MKIYNRYITKMLLTATVFISVILIAVTMLTQSLRFLELIVESGASTWSFWVLTFLSLPRFFEIIIPIGLAAASLFTLNRMATDSEIAVLKATGYSFWQLTRPIVITALFFSAILMVVTTTISPMSVAKMQIMRQIVKTQFSALMFREGVFTNVTGGLTVYIREKAGNGEFKGLVIQDDRDDKTKKTVYAKRGVLAATETGQEVVVFDGARQDLDTDRGTLQRLNFSRYTISLPEEKGPVKTRLRDPDERTFMELMNPPAEEEISEKRAREYMVEAHKRIISPFFAPVYCMVAACFLLLGTHKRQGHVSAIIMAVGTIILIQSLFLAGTNAAAKSNIALIGCYALLILPALASYIILKRGKVR
ncbi:MAG: LPS export ABC transporter permease LptF [Pseudobdellovibrionaceae bacterium]